MLKSCAQCGRIHPVGVTCPSVLSKRVYGKRDSQAARFRNTAAWKRKAAEVKRRDVGLCRVCLARGTATYKGLEVHHITPLEADYDRRLEDDNLITLCAACHKLAERGEIEAGELRALAGESPMVSTGTPRGCEG